MRPVVLRNPQLWFHNAATAWASLFLPARSSMMRVTGHGHGHGCNIAASATSELSQRALAAGQHVRPSRPHRGRWIRQKNLNSLEAIISYLWPNLKWWLLTTSQSQIISTKTWTRISSCVPQAPGLGRRFAAALLPRLNPRSESHHTGATGRVRTGDQRLPVICHCQLGQDIPYIIIRYQTTLNTNWKAFQTCVFII